MCGTSQYLQTKVLVVLSDLRVASRLSFQIIPLTVLVMSLSGELMLSVLGAGKATLLTFKCGGGVEEDKEQLGSMTLLVVTVFNQLIQLREVELTDLCQWKSRLRCVLGMLLDCILQLGMATVWS